MVALQIISKVLDSGDIDIIENNMLSEDYFPEYREEYNFIIEHFRKYGNPPDKATFLSRFPDVDLVQVTESDRYLVETIREEYLYYKSVPVVQKIAELLKTDSNAAVEYLQQSLKELQPNYELGGVDIVADSIQRLNDYIEKRDHESDWTFTTGFEELDELIHGIEREEELVVLFARINQGKSFVLEKICSHIWQIGFNVGYISPEMSASSIGYRFDTLTNGFSNKSLMWATNDINEQEYRNHIEKLQKKTNKFIVATPLDFDKKITVTKLKNWIKQYKLDLLAIDGITYLTDERFKRGDSKTISLTNISEDLMSLSMELKIPIIVVVQANRSGVVDTEDEDGTPELESIRDSDGIAMNASKVISLRHTKEGVLKLGIKKHRFGTVGGQLNYQWNVDKGEFVFIPSYDDAEPTERTEHKVRKLRKQMKDKEDVF